MASPRGRRRRSSKGRTGKPRITETSVPTGRAAYAETRTWLLKTHGPVCAYCGLTFPAKTLTLDHVTPRRGQSAYDRRDNLVLACARCNMLKGDKSFLAWVLGQRARARHLFLYGQHLSEGILDVLRPMVGDEVTFPAPGPPARPAAKKRPAKHLFGPVDDDGESPYHEASPYLDEAPRTKRKPIVAAKPIVAHGPPVATVKPVGAPKKKRRGRRGGRGRRRRA